MLASDKVVPLVEGTIVQKKRFVHLRLHTEFSIVDSTVRIDQAVAFAKNTQQVALAITDLANLFGFIKFYKACRKQGLKAIVGCDLYCETRLPDHRYGRLIFLCQNQVGYRHLCELISRSYLENYQEGIPVIKRSWLTPENTKHLIVLSGGASGDIGLALLAGKPEQAVSCAQHWSQLWPNNFYVEIQKTGLSFDDSLLQATVDVAKQCALPIVATHPIQFMKMEDFKIHEVRVCISKGWQYQDEKRPRHFTKHQYFLTAEEMHDAFAAFPDALENTLEIAKRCNVEIELNRVALPSFPTPEGTSLDEYLSTLAHDGLRTRLAREIGGCSEPQQHLHFARLKSELAIIAQMGFSGYFLIVAEFIGWSRQQNIPVGPGRGSGAGSLVAFATGITDLNPITYDLLFERFLNPERVSMPDFDIDFCQDGRHKIIEHVKKKYGADAVSQIITFGTLAARAAIRDTGRVLDLPYGFVDHLAKLIPFEPGKNITIKQARAMEPILAEREKSEEDVRRCLDIAEQLEGLTRNVSIHAGGILIAPSRLTNFCPLYTTSPHTEDLVSQYDKDDIEAVGLIKFDLLGLRTLTIIHWTIQRICAAHPEFTELVLDNQRFDDPDTFQLLCEANTTGVFQLESRGMKELLYKLRPSCFDDVIAVLALYRPGPLGSGMVDDFIARKNLSSCHDYFHNDLESVLRPTYGVIIYQEQVMLISQIISGYSLGKADLLRRAMGKKKSTEMTKHRKIFVSGAKKKGYDEKLAEHLFNLIEKFAEYGFNKSHSAAYAVIAYQTAWLKCHYPAEFMAATLSSDMNMVDKLHHFYMDCLKNKICVLPPCVNTSHYEFQAVDHLSISYGLGAIRGIGEAVANEIVRARASGPLTSLFDFYNRVDTTIVNRRAVESLIRAGAFDAIQPNRGHLLSCVSEEMTIAQYRAHNTSQCALFTESLAVTRPATEPLTGTWSSQRTLKEEKLALGFFISGHPYTAHATTVAPLLSSTLGGIQPNTAPQRIAGIVSAIQRVNGKRGYSYFITLDDSITCVDIILFQEKHQKFRDIIHIDLFLAALVKVSRDENAHALRLVVEELYTLDTLYQQYAHTVMLRLRAPVAVEALESILQKYRRDRGCVIKAEFQNERARCRLTFDRSWQVLISEELCAELTAMVGEQNVYVLPTC